MKTALRSVDAVLSISTKCHAMNKMPNITNQRNCIVETMFGFFDDDDDDDVSIAVVVVVVCCTSFLFILLLRSDCCLSCVCVCMCLYVWSQTILRFLCYYCYFSLRRCCFNHLLCVYVTCIARIYSRFCLLNRYSKHCRKSYDWCCVLCVCRLCV